MKNIIRQTFTEKTRQKIHLNHNEEGLKNIPKERCFERKNYYVGKGDDLGHRKQCVRRVRDP